MLHDLLHLLPLLIVVASGLLVLVVDLFAAPGPRGYLGWMSAAAFALAGLATYFLWKSGDLAFQTAIVGDMLVLDHFGLFWFVVILLTAALTALVSVDHMREQGAEHGEYYALVSFATAGMMVVGIAADLFTLFVGIETMSLSIYVLAGVKRRSPFAAEAALKYFVVGAVGSAILLYGIALAYGVAGTTNLAAIGAKLQADPALAASPLAYASLLLLLGGFSFKIAAVPFHMWTPDVYEGAPTPVTGFMAAGVKAASFAGLFRVLFVAFDADGLRAVPLPWTEALVGLAVVSMALGNLTALVQRNVKRMLAYSSIAHAGYLLVAFVPQIALGMEGGGHYLLPSPSLFYYLFGYALANLGAFGAISLLGAKGEEDMDIDRFAGLARRRPLVAAAFAVCLLSLAGIPPMAGFFGKFLIFRDVLEADGGKWLWLVIVAVLNSLVAVYYYLRPTVAMYFHPVPDKAPPMLRSTATYIALAIAALLTLHAGLLPHRYVSAAKRAATATVTAQARLLRSEAAKAKAAAPTAAVAAPTAAPPTP